MTGKFRRRKLSVSLKIGNSGVDQRCAAEIAVPRSPDYVRSALKRYSAVVHIRSSNMPAANLFERLKRHLVLFGLTLDGIVTFTRLVGHPKRDILQPQPINNSDPDFPLYFLPDSVAKFLGTAVEVLNIGVGTNPRFWYKIRVW